MLNIRTLTQQTLADFSLVHCQGSLTWTFHLQRCFWNHFFPLTLFLSSSIIIKPNDRAYSIALSHAIAPENYQGHREIMNLINSVIIHKDNELIFCVLTASSTVRVIYSLDLWSVQLSNYRESWDKQPLAFLKTLARLSENAVFPSRFCKNLNYRIILPTWWL